MEFILKFIFALLISAGLYYGVPAFTEYWIEYWACALIGFVVVFGGFLLLDGDFIH